MMVRRIVHHWYHMYAGIVPGGEWYNLSSYLFHKHLTIHVIMVVSCYESDNQISSEVRGRGAAASLIFLMSREST